MLCLYLSIENSISKIYAWLFRIPKFCFIASFLILPSRLCMCVFAWTKHFSSTQYTQISNTQLVTIALRIPYHHFKCHLKFILLVSSPTFCYRSAVLVLFFFCFVWMFYRKLNAMTVAIVERRSTKSLNWKWAFRLLLHSSIILKNIFFFVLLD